MMAVKKRRSKMNPLEYVPIVARQQHEELLKKAAQGRMLSDAFPTQKSKLGGGLKFLRMIKEEYLYLRYTLEARFSEQAETSMAWRQQSDPANCA
jgi:hypothetical protein